MRHLVLTLLVRAALASAGAWYLWHEMGPIGLVFSSVIFGVALASPLLDFFVQGVRTAKQMAWHDFDGRNFEFRGTRVRVVDDDEGLRWLVVADVRKILRGLPRDALLKRLHPDGCVVGESKQKTLYIEAELLYALLQKAKSLNTHKFRLWLKREVIVPGRRARGESPDDLRDGESAKE